MSECFLGIERYLTTDEFVSYLVLDSSWSPYAVSTK